MGQPVRTGEKLLRVQQLAGELLLQLVGLVLVGGQRALPVHAALAQPLGVQAVGAHPQHHALLQHVRQLVGPLPLGLGEGEGEEDHLGPFAATAAAAGRALLQAGRGGGGGGGRGGGGGGGLGGGGGGVGGDPTALRAGSDHLLHQGLPVVQGDVQAEVWGRRGHGASV